MLRYKISLKESIKVALGDAEHIKERNSEHRLKRYSIFQVMRMC